LRASSRDYTGKDCNLDLVADAIEEHFQTQGYETQSSKGEGGWLIRARKSVFLRDLLAGDRASTVILTGELNNFKASFGIGKWIQNIGMTLLEGIAIVLVVFFVEIPVSLWSYETEREFWAYIGQQVALRV
jgi:hypothetical protein